MSKLLKSSAEEKNIYLAVDVLYDNLIKVIRK